MILANQLYSQTTINRDTLRSNKKTSGEKLSDLKSKFYYGGNIGVRFGTITNINISPLLGFKVTKDLSIGGGVTYNYYSQNYYGRKYSSTVYGTNSFARYFIQENIFAQIGWDRLNVFDYTSPIPNSRAWVDNILIGGGIKQPISSRGVIIASIFYNLNQTPLSPYQNPIIQIGFNIGF
jgi:hypothetical protein